jgi:uncharacterized protein (TIGR03437 family)
MIQRFFLSILIAQGAFAAAVDYSYDAAGRLTRIDYGAAGSLNYSYDRAGNLVSRAVGPAGATSVITKVNAAWGGTDIAPNTFIEVKGNNLVPASTPAAGVIWSNAPDFASGRMPTNLSGVSVTVNGKPGYIYFYCSAVTSSACASDQIDVLTGLDTTTGPVSVVVTSGSTSTPPFTINVKAVAPTFLLFNPQGYVVATHANYTLLGPASLYPGSTTPAAPGETVIVYAVGFGLPTAKLTEGSSSQSGALATVPVCTVGGSPAPAAIALIASGLYQLNLTVPQGAKGDSALICTYAGATTQSGALLGVQ